MQSKTIKQIAWFSLVPQLIFMGLLIYMWYRFEVKNPFVVGAANYLILSFMVRIIICKDHRRGVKSAAEGKFSEAITHFKKSYDFFNRNKWLDKYRYLVLLSSSKISYREMALINMAFCYARINDYSKSKQYYDMALKEFPKSQMAKAGLQALDLEKTKGFN